MARVKMASVGVGDGCCQEIKDAFNDMELNINSRDCILDSYEKTRKGCIESIFFGIPESFR